MEENKVNESHIGLAQIAEELEKDLMWGIKTTVYELDYDNIKSCVYVGNILVLNYKNGVTYRVENISKKDWAYFVEHLHSDKGCSPVPGFGNKINDL